MENVKMKTIFTQKLAGYLMMHGFVLMKIAPHYGGNGKNVFYFKDSKEINAAIDEYLKNR